MTYDDSNPFAKILRGELPCIKVAETGCGARLHGSDAASRRPSARRAEGSRRGNLRSLGRGDGRVHPHDAKAGHRRACGVASDGVFIGQFNGAAAGQTVPHVHFHVIPRWEGQPLRMHARDMADADTLEALAKRIRAHWRAD